MSFHRFLLNFLRVYLRPILSAGSTSAPESNWILNDLDIFLEVQYLKNYVYIP